MDFFLLLPLDDENCFLLLGDNWRHFSLSRSTSRAKTIPIDKLNKIVCPRTGGLLKGPFHEN